MSARDMTTAEEIARLRRELAEERATTWRLRAEIRRLRGEPDAVPAHPFAYVPTIEIRFFALP